MMLTTHGLRAIKRSRQKKQGDLAWGFSPPGTESNKTNKILQDANDMIALKVARVCRVTKGVDSMVGDGTYVDN